MTLNNIDSLHAVRLWKRRNESKRKQISMQTHKVQVSFRNFAMRRRERDERKQTQKQKLKHSKFLKSSSQFPRKVVFWIDSKQYPCGILMASYDGTLTFSLEALERSLLINFPDLGSIVKRVSMSFI